MSKTAEVKFWDVVMNVNLFRNSAEDMGDTKVHKIISETSTRSIPTVDSPREEVLEVARFIANMEPSYINSQGRYMTLNTIRSIADYSSDDFAFLLDKFSEMVKDYIITGPETKIVGKTLRVKSTMQKGKLVKAALTHLLTGSEIFKNIKDYKALLMYSCLNSQFKANYAYMVGFALQMEYSSVPKLLNDVAISFVDQTNNINKHNVLMFYNGAVSVESL